MNERAGSVEAKAEYATKPEESLCVLALHKAAANAIQIDGSADVEAPECAFMANSPTVAQAVYFKGSGRTVGKSFCAVGDHTISGGRTVWPAPMDFCPPVLDPFADWTPPKEGPCDFRSKRDFIVSALGEVRLQPGHYCTRVDVSANTIVLEPGSYFFSDSVTFNASQTVTGNNVYLQFTDQSTEFRMNGSANVTLTKTANTKLRDIVIYIDPASQITPGLFVSGNADLALVGAIYAPKHDVYLTGRTTLYGTGIQTAIIASKVYLSGNTFVAIDPLPSMEKIGDAVAVRLIK